MCKQNPELCDGALAITLDRSPASNSLLRAMHLARPGNIIFECMSYATFAEARVKSNSSIQRSNGNIQTGIAIASFQFVCIHRPAIQICFEN